MWGALLPPGNWGVCPSCFLPPFLMATLRMEPRGFCMLSKHSATEVLPKPRQNLPNLILPNLISVFTYVKETSCVPSTQPRALTQHQVWICAILLCGPVLMRAHKAGPAHYK